MGDPWYRTFFRGDWQLWQAELVPRMDTPAQARFIAEKLALQPGQRVLDTVCGPGRHAIALAAEGYEVTGADLSELEIERAREAARMAGVNVTFLRCDMRDLPFTAEFDAAYNVFTSFGYFEDVEDDRKAIRAFRRALRAGGRFFIDLSNWSGILSHFQDREWRRMADGTLLLQEHRMDVVAGEQRDTWSVQPPDGQIRTYEIVLRMYAPYELRRELEDAGFKVTGSFGGWDGTPLTAMSRRLMLVAEAV